MELNAAVWAEVHGIASLLITNLHQSHDGQPDSQADRTRATLADNPERALRLPFIPWFRNRLISTPSRFAQDELH